MDPAYDLPIIRVAGVVAAVMMLWSVRREVACRIRSIRWPHVQGKILSVNYDDQPTTVRRLHYQYFVDLQYEYEVDGRMYLGTRISFDESLVSVRYGWQPEQGVRVYYCEANPAECVILRTMPPVVYLALSLLVTAALMR